MRTVMIHTDGACIGNPGPGGFAALIRLGDVDQLIRGGDPMTTNQRMELSAAIAGLEALGEPCSVEVISDSQYLVRGMTVWMARWQSQGWFNAHGDPVGNRDLWESLLALSTEHHIQWTWVRGHNGHQENEACDRIARAAATQTWKERRTETWRIDSGRRDHRDDAVPAGV